MYKKIIIAIFLALTLSACSDVVMDNISENSNSQIVVEQKIENSIGSNKNDSNNVLKNVSLNEFKTELEKKDGIVIDLRTDGEVSKGVIPGAKQIDFYSPDFKDKLSQLDKDKKYLIYCASGGRSGKTLGLMKNMGFTNIYELRGGMIAWNRAGEKTEKLGFKDEMMNMEGMDMDDMTKTITLNATKWQFDKTEIRVKKGDKVRIKVNNIDGLHGIAIPDMQLLDNDEIEIDTSKAGTYTYQCLNYCGEGHANMTGTLIIE